MADQGGNVMQVAAMQGDATFGRIPRSPPLMDENGGSAPGHRIGPIPVRQNHQIIERVRAAQHLVTMRVRGADHRVVVFVPWIIRPQIAGPDRHGPIGGARQTVGPIQHADNAVYAARGRTVAFAFTLAQAALADGAGVKPPAKAQTSRGQHHVVGGHGHSR